MTGAGLEMAPRPSLFLACSWRRRPWPGAG